MKKFTARLFCLLLCAAAVFSLCALPAAADEYYYTNPMPRLQITRTDMDPIQPGEEFTLTVSITQNSTIQTIQSPRVTFAPSSAFLILDATATKSLPNIRHKETANANIRLRALTTIENPEQYVDVKVEFDYDGGSSGLTVGTSSERIFIPVETTSGVEGGKPMVVITRGDLSTVGAGQNVPLHVYITNQSGSAINTPSLSVTPCGELLMMDATRTRQLESIQPGETLDVPINLRAAATVTSPSLSVELDLNRNGVSIAKETVYIPAYANSNGDSSYTALATPNVIIHQYSYGDSPSVAAGSTFDLDIVFENTSSVFTVENIVMTVNPGEGLSIASGSNTMHYPTLKAGETQSETVSITALPTAKTGSAKIDVSFSYEYVENRVRKSVQPSQTISIPIYQPDRFSVELPQMPEMVDAYCEMYLSLPYVNKGKSEVSNIRAELVSEDGAVTSINPVQNLGNFASGASGTIDFIFTPQMPGDIEFHLVITYEDPNAQEKSLDFPVRLTVNEPYYPSFDDPGMYDPGFYEEPVQKAAMPWWVWVLIAVAAAAAAVVVIVLVKKKKRASSGELSDFVWDPDASDAEPDTDTVGGEK